MGVLYIQIKGATLKTKEEETKMKITKEQAIAKAESIMYSDYHIHAGVERKVVAK